MSSAKTVRNAWLRCLIALTAEVFSTWLINVYLYPHFITLAPEARDIASCVSVATLVILAIVALNKPASINEGFLTPVALTTYSFGFILILIGLWQESLVALIAGVCFRSIGSRWIVVLAGISLCLLERRACMLCIASAFGLSYLLRIPFSFISYDVAIILLVSLIFVMYAACRPLALQVLSHMQTTTSAREASITEPASYLPFAHALFIAIFVFRIAYGFALSFESVDGTPQTTMLGIIPLGLLVVLALRKHQQRADILYEVAALLIVAGFLSIIVLYGRVDAFYSSIVNGCLFAGSECFEVLMWFALASIGARNMTNALAVLAWGRAASSFGLLCGATLGHWSNALPESLGTVALVSGVLFVFVAANLTVLKEFSFQGTIDGVQPVADALEAPPVDMVSSRALTAGCDEVAEVFRLTPREREILGMLAHGRNAPYIQDKLVLSRNTVKTHIQNIYAKLGVHSQQELIDVVEGFDKSH